jgi:hypothetical protein
MLIERAVALANPGFKGCNDSVVGSQIGARTTKGHLPCIESSPKASSSRLGDWSNRLHGPMDVLLKVDAGTRLNYWSPRHELMVQIAQQVLSRAESLRKATDKN